MNTLAPEVEVRVYQKAIHLIITKGWWNGKFDQRHTTGSLCLGNALQDALKEMEMFTFRENFQYFDVNPFLPHLNEVINEKVGTFNDNANKDDVLAALEIAWHLATPTPK